MSRGFGVLDCPAGIEGGFRNALAPADKVLVGVVIVYMIGLVGSV